MEGNKVKKRNEPVGGMDEPVAVMVNFFQLHQLEFGGAPIEELHQNSESSFRFIVLVNLDQVELECLGNFS